MASRETARETGLVEITPEVLLKAYACGIFPMAENADDPSLYWIEPEQRGVIPLEAFHIPRRLARSVRADAYSVHVDRDFAAVLDGCAAPGKGRARTWINARIRSLYTRLHEIGHCHSVEVYDGAQLVGGLYGVRLGARVFRREHVSSSSATPPRSRSCISSAGFAPAASSCSTRNS